MSGGWIAGAVRAKALAGRCSDRDRARRLAACASLGDALRALGDTPYGRPASAAQTLAAAQHAIAGAVLWDLRVLAGWLPQSGVRLLRVLAGWFEIANTDELLQSMAGRSAAGEFQLGALATAWPRLREASSPHALRASLAASPWRDPGSDTPLAMRLGMRTRWAERVAGYGDPVHIWAAGAAALLLACERFAAGRPVELTTMPALARLLGPAAGSASTFEELASGLPAHARWALAGVGSPAGLWQGEVAWWRRVGRDGQKLLEAAPGSGTVVGAVAVMCADARRTCAALEIAARGGRPLEAYDAVA